MYARIRNIKYKMCAVAYILYYEPKKIKKINSCKISEI